MENQFIEMNQIGICVRDLDRTISNMKKIFGCDPSFVGETLRDGRRYFGREGDFAARIALFDFSTSAAGSRALRRRRPRWLRPAWSLTSKGWQWPGRSAGTFLPRSRCWDFQWNAAAPWNTPRPTPNIPFRDTAEAGGNN